jgi:hypothetical protein
MEAERRHGTVTFVGVLFLLAAAWNVMLGVAALTITGNAVQKAPTWDKDTWGIILVIVGGLQGRRLRRAPARSGGEGARDHARGDRRLLQPVLLPGE